jgi:hypothetical protein
MGIEDGVSRILTVTISLSSEQSSSHSQLSYSNLSAASKIAHSLHRSHSAQIQGHMLFITQQYNVCSCNPNRSLTSFLQNKAIILNDAHCATAHIYREV